MITEYLWRAAFFGLLWLILTGAEVGSWVIGIPSVLGATAMSLALRPDRPVGVSVIGWLKLIPFFLWKSAVGGWDVARRVISPRMPIRPGFLSYHLRLREDGARWFFVHIVSLMPGTLSTRLDDSTLTLHALTVNAGVESELRATESRVAEAFGVSLGENEHLIPSP